MHRRVGLPQDGVTCSRIAATMPNAPAQPPDCNRMTGVSRDRHVFRKRFAKVAAARADRRLIHMRRPSTRRQSGTASRRTIRKSKTRRYPCRERCPRHCHRPAAQDPCRGRSRQAPWACPSSGRISYRFQRKRPRIASRLSRPCKLARISASVSERGFAIPSPLLWPFPASKEAAKCCAIGPVMDVHQLGVLVSKVDFLRAFISHSVIR